jgi:glycosyltransferase involved in cell wall biosynthesis
MTERRLLHTADGIIVHGRAQAEIVAGSQWARRAQEVFVIPHGALSQPAGTARIPDAPTVLFFGRAEYYKGLDVLVDAVLRVGDRLQGLRVVVAGRGPEIARARERVGRDPQFEWVERFISDDEIPDLFARCSVAVLPYRDASQSGVVPLAFANRRAVIATDVGSLAEAVEDGVTGMLVPPEDPDSLADAIVGIHRDRARLERMSDAALELTTTGALSTAAVASKHMDAYWALLRDCGGRQM